MRMRGSAEYLLVERWRKSTPTHCHTCCKVRIYWEGMTLREQYQCTHPEGREMRGNAKETMRCVTCVTCGVWVCADDVSTYLPLIALWECVVICSQHLNTSFKRFSSSLSPHLHFLLNKKGSSPHSIVSFVNKHTPSLSHP
jgi:hypothetical protein